MTTKHTFKSVYLFRFLRNDYNPFTPDILIIDDQTIYHKRRKWYLFSADYQKYHFQSITGVSMTTGLFGADIKVEANGVNAIYAKGFSKRRARHIITLCNNLIIKNAPKTIIDTLNASYSKLADKATMHFSVADELVKLKSLLDAGAITPGEYEKLKQTLLN